MLIIPKADRFYYIHNEPTLLTEEVLKSLQPPNRPQPIRLSKAWLAAFGFRPDPSAHSWTFEDARLIPGMNCWVCVATRRYLQYVHELQDLFEDYFNTELLLISKPMGLSVSSYRLQSAR
ncbi:hypothetical protein [Larkinella soli]|uniref:hypothetical protein n=1 Tax=Larkinella soli TaxID=1770527 RepID=UPI000FFC8921|nr:hypothetical protein [Larkinella soli]